MVSALLLLGVALVAGSYMINVQQPGVQRRAIRIEANVRKRNRPYRNSP